MGDKSPKSTHKQASQKEAKSTADKQKKTASDAAADAARTPPKK